jgi:hypothetical protein
MALSDKLIDAEAFARWGDMKGAPLAMCRGFARAIEAEARRDALEEAAKVCESIARDDYGLTKWHEYGECAAAIRKLKEDVQ